MAALRAEVKAFIIQRLACFESPSVVVEAVKQEFGIEVTRMTVAINDPTKASGVNLAKKWREMFAQSRAKFLDDTSTIPIANKAVRLNMLQRMADRAENSKNAVLAASLLEQAAKEVGDAYTNRYKIDSSLTIKAGDLGDAIGDLSRD